MASRKDVADVVSGMGLAMSIITNLVKAVREKGGSDEDIHRLATPEGEGLLKKIAEMVVQIKSAIKATFRVTVDCGKSLTKMITVGHYDSVNTDIIADHFPVKGEGKKETEVVLFHFGKTTTSGQVISEMEKAGCRPAQIEELLALGASQPDLQKQFPIVALGSVWRDSDGHRDVPYLHWGGVGRDLLLRWFGRGWTEDYRFLAVRK